ncbi:hypothetical protein JRO89_XS05G0079300 [Xanthoceras sorbifolium]|uniref:Ubiquitin-like protease family profile domain-containing protein n=1 Tax=Xanthoceras sorbifolium TaxID=99658 RepID=A0ABQ8I1C0_9ROSI|nr:hypothetical protein JRO89_XS05G0079300 [Xanthoceras sorbifolium]
MEEQVENRSKRKLDIDWGQILPERNDDPPAELIVEKDKPQRAAPNDYNDDAASGDEIDSKISDYELELKIERMKGTYKNLRLTLRDKGEKLFRTIKHLEDERQRRRLSRAEMDADGCEKPTQSLISGASDALRQGTASSQFQSRSSFASAFTEKLEESKNCRAFDKELSTLAACERWKIKPNEELSHVGSQKSRSSSRQRPFKSATSLSSKGDKSIFSSGDQKGRAPSTYLSHNAGKNISSCFPKTIYPNMYHSSIVSPFAVGKMNFKSYLQISQDKGRLKFPGPYPERTLVLLDEDEYPLEETPEKTLHVETTEEEDKLDECMKDAKIYYPSRDDPESVEICYTDISHLAPGAYLTSPIMNFYIRVCLLELWLLVSAVIIVLDIERYLQQQASPTNRAIYDCHFFNTYFYKKLKEAVSYKGVDKNSFFIKFRRWWKGVNIFQKAYVLIPIHEDLHWSLVIISIPNKEEESGPIILHLDSLGLHSSKSVFDNIRSFLKEEWNYLNEEVSPSDLPIADRIWKHLRRRIDEKVITVNMFLKYEVLPLRAVVPQQKNDYDCGLFVLFFMERFIEEAPERLKKEDLAMFGKRWFRPEEASGLRVKIRNLLKEEFELSKEGCCISKSPWSSGQTRA